ncbi:MAG: NAD(P)/FAD-dependent oxidoreductase [Anaerolineales bacterium]
MKFVIIGSGVAGMTAALDLSRRADAGAAIHLYTDEPYSYYYRPQVTNYLAGLVSLEKVVRRPVAWYAERGIEMHLEAPVAAIRPNDRVILLEEGRTVSYDKLLVATGSHPFIPPLEGVEKEGVFTLRTLEDAVSIKEYAEHRKRAVVIGGGLLGLESARGMQGMGLEVAIVELFPWLMPTQLDEMGGEILKRFANEQGYEVRTGSSGKSILGEGEVEGLLLSDGETLEAQMVIVAAGVRPNTRLAEDAGLEVSRGVVVNERLETSAPDVYAAGDNANFHKVCWAIAPVAQAQARVAAANMAGEEATYDPVTPSTSLKVVDIDVSSAGKATVRDNEEGFTEVRFADPDTFVYRKAVLREGKLVGAIVMGDKELAKTLIGKVEERAAMTPEEAERLLSG